MIKHTLISLATISMVGCVTSNNYSVKTPTNTVKTTTITVEKPDGGVYVSPMVFKGYTCDELNEEFIGVSDASLQNLISSVDNASPKLRPSILEKHRQELQNQQYENNQADFDAKLYAITKASKKIEGCKMYMNNKEIILSE